MKSRIAMVVSAVLVLGALLAFAPIAAPARADSRNAATYTFSAGVPWQVVTVTTSAVVTVVLTPDDYYFEHLNIQDDGSTGSVATDYVVTMRSQDASGGAVSMDATYTDGIKNIILAGKSNTVTGRWIPIGADGACEIQLKAVGHGCKMKIVRNRSLMDTNH